MQHRPCIQIHQGRRSRRQNSTWISLVMLNCIIKGIRLWSLKHYQAFQFNHISQLTDKFTPYTLKHRYGFSANWSVSTTRYTTRDRDGQLQHGWNARKSGQKDKSSDEVGDAGVPQLSFCDILSKYISIRDFLLHVRFVEVLWTSMSKGSKGTMVPHRSCMILLHRATWCVETGALASLAPLW